jgi:hypothetical protein
MEIGIDGNRTQLDKNSEPVQSEPVEGNGPAQQRAEGVVGGCNTPTRSV